MANQELSELTVATTIAETDILYKVNSPYASGDDRYITAANLRAELLRQFAQTATVTVANTAAETTLIGAGQGSAALSAGYLNTVGKQLHFKLWGVVSDTGTPTLNLKVKFGSTVLAQTGAVTLAGGLANAQLEMDVWVVCRTTGATGTVFAHGLARVGTTLYPMSNTAASGAIDLTIAITTDVTATWGAADPANTLSAHILDILKAA